MTTTNHFLSNVMSGSNAFALILGGLLTPVAIGLSLQLLPMGPPILIFALIGGIFAFRHPKESWQWDLWPAGGILVALNAVLLITGSIMWWGGNSISPETEWGSIKVTLVFGFVPALAGGCLGGTGGSLLARESYKQAGMVISVFVALMIAIVVLVYVVY